MPQTTSHMSHFTLHPARGSRVMTHNSQLPTPNSQPITHNS
jgi:hypothetical protein